MKSFKTKIKKVFFSNQFLRDLANQFFMSNKFRIKKNSNNQCIISCLLHDSSINIVGSNNKVVIENSSAPNKIDIVIVGNNNTIHIGQDVFCRDVKLWIEDDNNSIKVNRETVFAGSIQLSAIEGTSIVIEEKCLFSDDIDIRTGDGHSILNEQNERTNGSGDILIGEHVWCGRGVSILKSAIVPANSVIATRSVVTKKYKEQNIMLAGCPAKIVKQNINWAYERK